MSLLASRSTLLRAAGSQAARRQMSTMPKLHKASEKWAGFVKERPPKDHFDEHLVFHPPYNGIAVGFGILSCWLIGWGTMAYGVAHQQYKQGYWK